MGAAAPRDWDAATYDRVSAPQVEWAHAVLDRLAPRGDELVLDAGCGSGRVTKLLLERIEAASGKGGGVIAVDASPAMVERAAAVLGERAQVLRSDLLELALPTAVDAVFSNAVFHWVTDHDLLFQRLFAALKPGGRLVAQCGGAGNVERFLAVAGEVGAESPFAAHLAELGRPWSFASAEETGACLARAGFEGVSASLEPWPVRPAEPLAFLEVVCLGHHLAALPEALRRPYAEAVLARCGEPLALDYVRLNVDATRPDRLPGR